MSMNTLQVVKDPFSFSRQTISNIPTSALRVVSDPRLAPDNGA